MKYEAANDNTKLTLAERMQVILEKAKVVESLSKELTRRQSVRLKKPQSK